jgi:hypothetical protein
MKEVTIDDLRRNQQWLLGLFLYSALNGALRKWFFVGSTGINNILLVGQLLVPFFLFFFMKREKHFFTYMPLVPYAMALILFALNPMNMTIYHGIFGFIMHFGFWLMLFTYINERDVFPLENLIRPFIIVCFLEVILAAVQFNLPILHPINRYESGDSTSGFEGGLVRVSGTFSYIGGYGAFLYFFGFLVWALMVENKRRVSLIMLLAAFCLFGAFMNGSRTTTLAIVVFIAFGFWGYDTAANKIRILLIIPILLVFASIYNVGAKLPAIGAAYNAFMGRVDAGQRTGESSNRVFETVYEIVVFESENTLFGLGLGATYQGATQTWGQSHYVAKYGFYEEEPERILLEGGYVLFIIRAFLFLLMIRQLKIPLIYSIPVMAYLFFFAQMVSSTFQSCFTFFGIAILDKMYYLKSLETDTEIIEVE